MPRRRPPHIRRETTRHGARVWYFRRDGKRIRLPDEYGTREFWDAYHAALTGHQMPKPKAPTTSHGTVAWLVEQYQSSAKWRDLAPSTQRVRSNLLRRLVAKAGTVQVKTLTRAHIQRGMDDRAAKPEAANAWLKSIRQLLDFAFDRGVVERNVAKDIKALRPTRKGGHKTWTPAEVEAFEPLAGRNQAAAGVRPAALYGPAPGGRGAHRPAAYSRGCAGDCAAEDGADDRRHGAPTATAGPA
jgi:ribosomal protein S20